VYFKPGADFYFGNRSKTLLGFANVSLIVGTYKYNGQIEIFNPVWGGQAENINAKMTWTGMELGIGLAQKIEKHFELKIYTGGRFLFTNTYLSEHLHGIIPGFGRTLSGYTGAGFCNIIFSYCFQEN
jgi:hypothetical protein